MYGLELAVIGSGGKVECAFFLFYISVCPTLFTYRDKSVIEFIDFNIKQFIINHLLTIRFISGKHKENEANVTILSNFVGTSAAEFYSRYSLSTLLEVLPQHTTRGTHSTHYSRYSLNKLLARF